MRTCICQHGVIVVLAVFLSGCISGSKNGIEEEIIPESGLVRMSNHHLRGLRWLKMKQNQDGSWGQNPTNQPALTGLAVLAFLSHAETPVSEEFGKCVERGMWRMVAYADAIQSNRSPPAIENGHVSSKGILSWALAESYGMIRAPVLLRPASDMMDRLVQTETTPHSVWRSRALWGAYLAGIPMGSRDSIRSLIRGEHGDNQATDPLSAAISVNVLQLSSTNKTEREHCSELTQNLRKRVRFSWFDHDEDYPLLTWYVCDWVFFSAGSEAWRQWNTNAFPEIMKQQVVIRGKENEEDVGYWEVPISRNNKGQVEKDVWGNPDSDVYATAIVLMCFPPMRCLPSLVQSTDSPPCKQVPEDVKVMP